ncbi:alpha/beta hydrolase fold domain-containing protein [Trichoderma breve]|uniref:Alpha/beta hydrolase fold domain-containing protein n=1 Tax=Trichoderma breve TaxID=2034170 RepID=A0A9W9B9G7_9HYPO|nr:alpha/beta hydrolase fold domain-containing protein [Trichoderma breve]KAJ4855766.1 alpha/beta hydrolase fold domain-containing protein [Trichoderma breve]
MSLPRSKTLPPTPILPDAVVSGCISINNIEIWYALYGAPLSPHQTPTVFLHGGKISSRWWAHQIRHVAGAGHPIIAMDTRAHGRSTDDPKVALSYDLFADDVVALLDHLQVPCANFVGWSDGANTCLSLAMRHKQMVKRIFSFGPNYRPDQAIPYAGETVPFVSDLMNRMKEEYEAISPTPEKFDSFKAKVVAMQEYSPMWTEEDFSKINTNSTNAHQGPLVWIVTGDSEELIQGWVAQRIADMIQGAVYLALPDVSHFAPLQDPEGFNKALDQWLSQ